MSLREKQMGERNRIGMIIGLMITVALIALEVTALFQGEPVAPRAVALVAGVVSVLAQIIGFKRHQFQENFYHYSI